MLSAQYVLAILRLTQIIFTEHTVFAVDTQGAGYYSEAQKVDEISGN